MGFHYPFLEPCRFCDLVFDGTIQFNDFAVFALRWLDDGCSEADGWCDGADLTYDSLVDARDLQVFADCWLVTDTEAPDGLLAEIVEQAPRLWRETEGLRSEHVILVGECARLLDRVESSDSPLSLRRQVNLLLGRFERHRYRGADLVYEAYDVDIGGG